MTRFRLNFATCVLGLVVAATVILRGTASAATVPGDFPTIQAAINAVIAGALPNGTTIDVLPGIYHEALVVSGTSRSFTVRGVNGAAATVVDAAGKNAAALTFYFASGQVVIRGLTFRNGAPPVAAGGGFVIQQSSPSLVDCVFEANAAQFGGGGTLITANPSFTNTVIRNNVAARSGGGVYMVDGSRPIFLGGEISGNQSGTGGPGVGNVGVGGGIDARNSSPTFRGTRIIQNRSKFAAGGIYHGGQFGSSYGVAALLLEDAEVSDNISSPYGPGDNPSEGGGIHIEDNAVATLTRSRVLRNTANSGGGLNAYRARYELANSILDGNRAVARSDGGVPGGFGGAIHAISMNVGAVHPASVVNLTGTLVRNSTGITGGGIVVTGDVGLPATLTLTDSVVDGNQGQNQGGGILLSRANLTSNNSLIIRNSVLGGSNLIGGGMALTTESAATIANTTVAQNTAGVYGGGIFIDGTVTLAVSNSHIYDNRANLAGGMGGGGLFVGPNGNNTGQVVNSIIADNTGYQIVEHPCPATRLTYNDNTITPKSGNSDLYVTGCSPAAALSSISAFNALGNTSNNNSNLPRFVHFLAAPAAGSAAALTWSVGRATAVTIAGVGTFNNTPTGTADVAPGSSTTYTLTASASGPNGGAYSPVAVNFSVVLPRSARITTDSDFDGNGSSDFAIFRPSTGVWWIRSALGSAIPITWGGSGDIPVARDYLGDGTVDVAVFRPSTGVWYVRGMNSVTWGGGNDVPVPADYTGDGMADIAVFRPTTGEWYIRGLSTIIWGGVGDIPVPNDYDGDRVAEVGVFRPSTGTWYIRGFNSILFGGNGDIPVPADYDGDGKADIAVYRPSTGVWYIRGQAPIGFGAPGDIPVPGDFDGNGTTDLAVFRPSTGTWYVRGVAEVVWGGAGDVPIGQRP